MGWEMLLVNLGLTVGKTIAEAALAKAEAKAKLAAEADAECKKTDEVIAKLNLTSDERDRANLARARIDDALFHAGLKPSSATDKITTPDFNPRVVVPKPEDR